MSWVFDVHKCALPGEAEIREHEPQSIWKCPDCQSRWLVHIQNGLNRMDFHSVESAKGWNSGPAGTPVDFSKIPNPDSTVTGRLSYNEPAFEDFPPEAYDRDMAEGWNSGTSGTPESVPFPDEGGKVIAEWDRSDVGGTVHIVARVPDGAEPIEFHDYEAGDDIQPWISFDPVCICGLPKKNIAHWAEEIVAPHEQADSYGDAE